jgi:hypothetical protein
MALANYFNQSIEKLSVLNDCGERIDKRPAGHLPSGGGSLRCAVKIVFLKILRTSYRFSSSGTKHLQKKAQEGLFL